MPTLLADVPDNEWRRHAAVVAARTTGCGRLMYGMTARYPVCCRYHRAHRRRAAGAARPVRIFAHRDDGRWRIAVDYDSTDGGTITADTFAAAAAADGVEAFAG
jgi:hypothetical protein